MAEAPQTADRGISRLLLWMAMVLSVLASGTSIFAVTRVGWTSPATQPADIASPPANAKPNPQHTGSSKTGVTPPAATQAKPTAPAVLHDRNGAVFDVTPTTSTTRPHPGPNGQRSNDP